MNINLIKFMEENQSSYVSGLREKINTSLKKGNLTDFNKCLNELKEYFYGIINSFDGEVIL